MDEIRIMLKLDLPLSRQDRLELGYLYGGSIRYQPGETLGPRVLRDFELVLIIEGQVGYQIHDQSHRLVPGSVVLARPGFQERYAWDCELRTRHAYFHFGIDAIPHHWPDLEGWPRVRRQPDPVVAGLFRSVLDRSHRRGDHPSGSPPPTDVHLVEMLIELLLEGSAVPPPMDDMLRPEPVARAIKWMRQILEERPSGSVSLSELARQAGVSPKHLCRVFKRSVGHPPMETFRLLRLQAAVTLLLRSNLTVKEIAVQCGFDDPLYFSRCFSAAFGRSPRRMREELKEGKAPPTNPLPLDITPRVHW